jgi:hypothetical protein
MSQIITEGLGELTAAGGWNFAIAAAGRGAGDVAAIAYRGSEMQARVDASGAVGCIEGVVANVSEVQSPLVLLVDLSNRAVARITLAERLGDSGVARFDNLPAGEYLVLFEPAGTTGIETIDTPEH